MTTPNETPQETLLWSGSPSQWTNIGVFLLCLILALGVGLAYLVLSPPQPLILLGLIVPVAWAIWRWIATRCHRYEVTSERVKITTGLLSRHTQELELYRVRDYSIVEPFWLRVVGCGNVVLVTADSTNPALVLRAVPNAANLKDQIRTHTERMRQRRGVRSVEMDSGDLPS